MPVDREIDDTYTEQQALSSLAQDQEALKSLDWDEYDERPGEEEGTVDTYGYNATAGMEAKIDSREIELEAQEAEDVEVGAATDLRQRAAQGDPRATHRLSTQGTETFDPEKQTPPYGERAAEAGSGLMEGARNFMGSAESGAVKGAIEWGVGLGLVDRDRAKLYGGILDQIDKVRGVDKTAMESSFGDAIGRVAPAIHPMFKALRAVRGGVIGTKTALLIAESTAAAMGLDPNDKNIASMIPEESLPAWAEGIRDLMAIDPKDPEWMNRARNFAENAVLWGAGTAGFRAAQWIGSMRSIRQANIDPPPETPDTMPRVDESRGLDVQRRVGTTGQYVGAPKGITSPQQIGALSRRLEAMATDAVEQVPTARYWYERSGEQILKMFDGDPDQAERFVLLLAALSRGNPVRNNLDHALRAWNQYHAGGRIRAGRFPNKDEAEYTGILNGTGNVAGLKRSAFYANLMQEIDPTRVPADAATIDVHMMRAFGFTKADGTLHKGQGVTPQQYAFAQREVRKIADRLGWTPHQVQAAVWVSQKAKTDGTSVAVASVDFADALESTRGQISWEAIPHPEYGGYERALFGAPPEVKAEYHRAAADAFLDANGRDIVAKELNIPGVTNMDAPGAFEGGVQPGAQTILPMPGRITAKAGDSIDEDTRLLYDTYASIRARLLRQKAIAWHRPIYRGAKKDQNGVEFSIGRNLTAEETDALYKGIVDAGGDVDWAPIQTPTGFRILNFGDTLHTEFREKIKAAAATLDIDVDADIAYFRSEGNYLENPKPAEDPNSENSFRTVRGAGRPDLQGRADDIYAKVGARLDAIDEDFAARYGWEAPRKRTPEIRVDETGPREFGGLDEKFEQTRLDIEDAGSGRPPEGPQLDLPRPERNIASVFAPNHFDPEGRPLIAKFIAGVRNPGGPDTALSRGEAVQVANVFADALVWLQKDEGRLGSLASYFSTGDIKANMPYSPAVLGVAADRRNIDQRNVEALAARWKKDRVKSVERHELFSGPENYGRDERVYPATPEEFFRYLEGPQGETSLFHELGHLLDLRIGKGSYQVERTASGKDMIGEFGLTEPVIDEMIKLSRYNRPEMWDKGHIARAVATMKKNNVPEQEIQERLARHDEYRHSATELFADSIAVYMENPAFAKEMGPEFSKWLRSAVNENPRVNPIIQFASAAGISIPLLGGEAEGEEKVDLAQLGPALRKGMKRFLKGKAGEGAENVAPSAPKALPGEADILKAYDPYRDDAFNIEGIDFNMDRLETTEQAMETIDTVSRAYAGRIDKAKHGVVPHRVTRQVADLLGSDEATANAAVAGLPSDVEGLHVRALVMRDMLVKSAEDVDKKAYRIMNDPTAATDNDRLEFRRTLARHVALQTNMKGVQTEIARALSAFRIQAGAADPARAQMMNEALNSVGGRNTIDELAKLWLVTPVHKRAQLAQEGVFAKTVGSLRELWINGLLSGARTHEINLLSNQLFTLWQVPERAVAGLIGTARAAGKTLVGETATDRVYMRETLSLLHGLTEGIPDALNLGWKTFRTGEPASGLGKIEQAHRQSISSVNWGIDQSSYLGRFVDLMGLGIRLPGRFLMSADEFQKGIGRSMERRALAARLSQDILGEGGTPQEAVQKYTDVMAGVDNNAEASINQFADTITFTKQLGAGGQAFQTFASRVPGAWVILPFVRTPANIVKEFISRTPAAPMLKEVREDLMAGGARRDKALAKISTGTAAMWWASSLASAGIITGGGPSDYRMRATWLQKYSPYSVNVKKLLGEETFNRLGLSGEWVPYGRLEPLGLLFGIASDLTNYRTWAPRDVADEATPTLAIKAVSATLMAVSEKTFFTGLSDFAAAYKDPERYGESWIAKLGGSVMPFSSMVRDIESAGHAQRSDVKRNPYTKNPVAAQFEAILNEYKARTPGFAEGLPNRLNHWGEEIKAYEGEWYNAFNAFAPRKIKAQAIDEELLRLRHPMTMPAREAFGIKLDAHRYHTLVKGMNEIKVPNPALGGKTQNMREYMNWMVGTAAYQTRLSDNDRIEMVKNARGTFLDTIKSLMIQPGGKYFDQEFFGWYVRKKALDPFGKEFVP